ncbi:MAG: sodium:solute symporter [Bacteroidota bacterium]|nr:sodium:solute symporter [Bacteroidota bacterium]
MLTLVDYIVIVVYLVGVAALGIYMGGRQRSTSDYFLGSRNLPWWAVCFSVVATETSTLTIISVPAIAYGGSMTFLQITGGYLLGRLAVSVFFLPEYFKGNLTTAYAFLGRRFGDRMRMTASVTFMVTRLLADGVRLFATAIPLKVIADSAGLTLFGAPVTYLQIIVLLGIVTVIYTMIGGIRAVVWMDVIQMILYLGGGLLAIVLLVQIIPQGGWSEAVAAGKFRILDFGMGGSFADWITQPYVFITALVGGGIFSMASHGTDQLIVQRLLTCRNVQDSRKALVGSAVVVAAQFALFLMVGALLWVHYAGQSPDALGLSRADEIFPKYMIEGLPAGLSGLLLAGILAAAMSTLSSSLNSLASSTMMDLYERLIRRPLADTRALRLSRWMTLAWGGLFVVFASLFEDTQNPIVELGLAIASFTYGGLLGAFLLGLLVARARESDAILAFIVTIGAMVGIIFGLWHHPEQGWIFTFMPGDAYIAAEGLRQVAWPWYTALGSGLAVGMGTLLSARYRLRQG